MRTYKCVDAHIENKDPAVHLQRNQIEKCMKDYFFDADTHLIKSTMHFVKLLSL